MEMFKFLCVTPLDGFDAVVLLVPELLLISVASGFSLSSRKIGTAADFPEHPSLGIHDIDGTTQCSSFAGASEIT